MVIMKCKSVNVTSYDISEKTVKRFMKYMKMSIYDLM